MFDWLGFKQGLPLWVSWRLNSRLKDDVKEVFEGIAETRRELLTSWANDYWRQMEWVAGQILADQAGSGTKDGTVSRSGVESTSNRVSAINRASENNRVSENNRASDDLPLLSITASAGQQLMSAFMKGQDWTELFVLDNEGKVLVSTYKKHEGTVYGKESPMNAGLEHAAASKGPCLFGPYGDEWTREIGPRSSPFHDKMTLMFIYPLVLEGRQHGYVCGRVPNDVLGDLIQRESGHIYPDSGDNYIFMARPVLNRQILPGTALSRSRFEDRTFTGGENLKDGVTTDWGVVSVKEHTELELIFTNPATGELHPGVSHTISKGSNLFVEFPGYSDYRHVPVIGKGLTFQLPYCPDVWGMMCEADLEEVYRIRSIGWSHWKLHAAAALVQSFLLGGAGYAAARLESSWLSAVLMFVLCLISGLTLTLAVHRKATVRVTDHLRRIIRFIRSNAEGKGDLTQRLSPGELDNNETRELAKWINNMIDSLEGIMIQVKAAAGDVMSSQQVLLETAQTTVRSTGQVAVNVNGMISGIRGQLQSIDVATEAFGRMQDTLLQLEKQSSRQIQTVLEEVDLIGGEMGHISAKVGDTNLTIRQFMDTIQQISGILNAIEDISAQTNLLALNASIEAARVGEQGKGFAVVASEIRKLASLTRHSTEEVAGIIERIEQDAGQAYQSMDEGTLVIEQSNERVKAAASKLEAVRAEEGQRSAAVEEAVSEVVELMNHIAAISRENRRVSHDVEDDVQMLTGEISQVRHTSQSVKVITSLLQHLVGQFRLTESRLR